MESNVTMRFVSMRNLSRDNMWLPIPFLLRSDCHSHQLGKAKQPKRYAVLA